MAETYKLSKTTRKARIKRDGKWYERVIYEFLDEDTGWWRDCVKLGSMSAYNPECYVPLDTFEDDEYRVIELASGTPGRWF